MHVCKRKTNNSHTHTLTPSLTSSSPHILIPSHSHSHTLTHTIIEVVNSCLEVMQEHSRSHVPCEGGGEGRGGERKGGEEKDREGMQVTCHSQHTNC